MSIFDTIIDGISDLGTDVFGNSTPTVDVSDMVSGSSNSGGQSTLSALSTLGNTAIKGLGNLNNAEAVKGSKENALYRFLQIDSAKMPTDQIGRFPVTKTGFDNANYSANAEDIQATWNKILQGYVSNSVSPQSQVSKYQS